VCVDKGSRRDHAAHVVDVSPTRTLSLSRCVQLCSLRPRGPRAPSASCLETQLKLLQDTMQTVLGASKQHQAILLHEAAEKRMNNDGA
jgi:hypothetical protein